jgi:hypothetical protein
VASLSEATIASYTSLPKSAFNLAIWRSSPAIYKVQFGNHWDGRRAQGVQGHPSSLGCRRSCP